jgi:diguanylate cyclase (GGDEF)-like protein
MTIKTPNRPFTISSGNATVSTIAAELWTAMNDPALTADEKTWRILERMIAYADRSEKRISEQSERIAYLEALSSTDELTGLLNRRAFVDNLERTLANARRYKESGLLAYIDLDGFKTINDTHGHDAGDAVLREIGSLLKNEVRATDFVARLGGDEFVILMVRADALPAKRRIAKLKTTLNLASVMHKGVLIPIRASIGSISYSAESNAEDLLVRADRAMYRDKRARAEYDLRSVAAG